MADDVLSPEQYFRSNKLARKSVYWLSPNEYLAMSLPLRPGGDMYGSMLGDVKRRMRAVEMSPGNERQKFFDIPTLSITDDGQVIHHNGRHRARAFRDAGLEKIPVALHRYGGGTFENAPPRLVSETGIFTMQAPWQAGPTEDGFPIPRPEYSSPTSRSPELPRPTPFGQSLIEEYGAISPQQSIEDYRENPDTNPLRDQELEELEQKKRKIQARLSEIDEEGRRLFGGGEFWWHKTPEQEAAMSEELREKFYALTQEDGNLSMEKDLAGLGPDPAMGERSIDRRFHDAREKEILSRWGEGTDPNNPYSSRSSGRAAVALVEARNAEDALRGTTPGTPEHRQAASRLALAKQKANDIIGLPEAPRGAPMPDTPDSPGAAGVFERQRRRAAEATEAPQFESVRDELGDYDRRSRQHLQIPEEDLDRARQAWAESLFENTYDPSQDRSAPRRAEDRKFTRDQWEELSRDPRKRGELNSAQRRSLELWEEKERLSRDLRAMKADDRAARVRIEERWARQERIRDLEREIYEQERRLSDLNPDTPSGRQARSRIERAKALLGRLAHLAGVAGTAYEGGRLAGEIGRHGPIEGTVRYGGTVAEETGDLLSLPKTAAEMIPGYGEQGVNLPAEILGAAGQGLQRGGRLLRGEDPDPIRGVGLDPSVGGLEDIDLGIPDYVPPELTPEQREELRRAHEQAEPMPSVYEMMGRPRADIRDVPGELRRNAVRRALMSSREREEENL